VTLKPDVVDPLVLPAAPAVSLDIEDIYYAHVAQVTRWVGRLAGPGHEVEDLVQEVFLRVHRRLSSFRGESQLSTWIYAITENVVRARRRGERLRRLCSGGPSLDDLQLRAPGPTPLEALERRRSNALIYAALDGLAEKYRTLFILFEIEGLPGEQIALYTGISVATVWVRLTRARAKLAARLERLEKRTVSRG